MPDKKCVVIGGGITGMATTVILAQQGFPVTLIEKHNSLAPLLRGFSRDGHHFDTGFHFAKGLEKKEPLNAWLEALKLNLPLNQCVPVIEKAFINNQFLPVPCNYHDIERYYPDAGNAFNQLCTDAQDLKRSSPFLSAKRGGNFSTFVPARTPLTKYFDELDIPIAARHALESRCMLFGVPPANASLEDFLLVTGNPAHKGLTIPGGGLAVVKAFEQRLRELHTNVILGKAVRKIIVSKRHISGVVLENDESLEFELIVYTGNPKNLRRLLPNAGLRPAWFTHLENMEATPEPYIRFGLCREAVPDNHIWYINPHKKYFGMLESGKPSLCVMTGESDSNNLKTCSIMALTTNPAMSQNPDELIFSIFPQLREEWRPLGTIMGSDYRKYIFGSDGSIFGYAHTVSDMPVLPITRLHGLYLAGQNIQLPGLLGCIVSAAIAAALIAGFENVLQDFWSCVSA